ncbi:hypothetical protein [Dyella mobilis]|uniref:Uncharacterized protein n=1 Tax=Dyella mobilis TaxID=1849582 RepID=A0ABS2KKH3_9GAMM|nr:hypothetical protein [Dyella mobilis]MBM7131651.1 hypothetical protein [Dyella mobilis]GLQ96373.1 hypothetical protein GCM10007863_07910 [Dyella mobilis]
MRKVQGLSIAIFCTLALSTPAFASPPNASDGQAIDKVETVQLAPNTPSYVTWANWIRDEITRDTANYHDYRNGQFVAKAIRPDVDIITLRRAFYTAGANASSSSHTHVLPDDNKPAFLPVAGEPGEHLSIISQTKNTYLSWTYLWNLDADGGRGGWQLTDSAFHECAQLPMQVYGARCENH